MLIGTAKHDDLSTLRPAPWALSLSFMPDSHMTFLRKLLKQVNLDLTGVTKYIVEIPRY
jgi:hypothetical protein